METATNTPTPTLHIDVPAGLCFAEDPGGVMSAVSPREANLASLRARVDLTPTELWLLDEVTSLDHEHYAAHLEIAKLRAQVAELLPWAQYGARKVREFGDDVVMTIEIANGKVSPLIRPAAQNLLRRVHTGGFGEVGR